MSKAILISIRPKWCELIASGKKTIEIRKTRPKLDTPFKCYIYETKGRVERPSSDEDGYIYQEGRGAVVGEFVCDEIDTYDYEYCTHPEIEMDYDCGDNWFCIDDADLKKACLSYKDFRHYAGKEDVYGWHISALKMYDEPKKLREFTPCCTFMLDEKQCDYRKIQCLNQQDSFLEEDGCNCLNFVKRPPQSWMYVEELE